MPNIFPKQQQIIFYRFFFAVFYTLLSAVISRPRARLANQNDALVII